MNQHLMTFVRLIARQAVDTYRKSPVEFEFFTIIARLSQKSRARLLEEARKIKKGMTA